MPAIRSHAGSGNLIVAVSLTDTGSGIPSANLLRIFELFFTIEEVGNGTGLGLGQVFGFAKRSGSGVDVASEPGRGTTFTLYLPEILPPAAQVGSTLMDYPRATGLCLVGIADNLDVGRFAMQVLQDLGNETVWATDAGEFVVEIGKVPFLFDAVFSDVVMPGMGGITLARILRRRMPDLPVVLATGYSHVLSQDALHGFELVHKPYSADELSRMRGKVAVARRANCDDGGDGARVPAS